MLLTAERLLFGWASPGGVAAGAAGAHASVTGHKDVATVVRLDATVVAVLRGVKVGSSAVSGSVGAAASASGYVLWSPTTTGDVLSVVIAGRVIA